MRLALVGFFENLTCLPVCWAAVVVAAATTTLKELLCLLQKHLLLQTLL